MYTRISWHSYTGDILKSASLFTVAGTRRHRKRLGTYLVPYTHLSFYSGELYFRNNISLGAHAFEEKKYIAHETTASKHVNINTKSYNSLYFSFFPTIFPLIVSSQTSGTVPKRFNAVTYFRFMFQSSGRGPKSRRINENLPHKFILLFSVSVRTARSQTHRFFGYEKFGFFSFSSRPDDVLYFNNIYHYSDLFHCTWSKWRRRTGQRATEPQLGDKNIFEIIKIGTLRWVEHWQ